MAQDARTAQKTSRPMDRARLDGVELEYEVRGVGDPVVLVHAGVFADWHGPLLEQPVLAGRHRIVNYHRVATPAAATWPGR